MNLSTSDASKATFKCVEESQCSYYEKIDSFNGVENPGYHCVANCIAEINRY